jgi:hypothetical protein
MADRIGALLAEAPGLERASELAPVTLPVLPPFEHILPFGGLRPGTTVGITGVGATSLALALVARLTEHSWTAAVGMPVLGLHAAQEFGVALDRLVVVPDPGKQWEAVLASLVDAFDVVLIVGQNGAPRTPRRGHHMKLAARARERDALLVIVGRWPECDMTLQGTSATWHGIGHGHGHLRTRTIDLTVTGRGGAARPRLATLWLPDTDGNVSLAQHTTVLAMKRAR